jgi:hypothetical protein
MVERRPARLRTRRGGGQDLRPERPAQDGGTQVPGALQERAAGVREC